MVREEYLHRMVLGRSAFEPPVNSDEADERESQNNQATHPSSSDRLNHSQQYNARGHPENRESRQLARRSRRAQNDVLSTIGVCVSVDENGKVVNMQDEDEGHPKEKEQTLMNIHENLAGFRAGIVDDVLSGLATHWCSNLRKRVMTFDFYLGAPIAAIVASEFKHFGPGKFFFAGMLPSAVLHFTVYTMETTLHTIRGTLQERLLTENDTIASRRKKRRLIWGLDVALTCVLFTLTVAPVQFLITLQKLDLISPWIPIPRLTGTSFRSLLFPSLPLQWTRQSALAYIKAMATSPMAGLAMSTIVNTIVDERLTAYVSALLPRPDNPDPISYKTDVVDGEYVDIPVLTLRTMRPSLEEELARDYHLAKYATHALGGKLMTALRDIKSKISDVFQPGSSSDDWSIVDASTLRRWPIAVNRGNSWDNPPANEVQQDRSTTPPGDPPPAMEEGNDTPQTIRHYSFSISRRSSTSTSSSDFEPSNIQVRARPGSSSTLHMDLEVTGAIPNTEGPVYTSSFAASPHQSHSVQERSGSSNQDDAGQSEAGSSEASVAPTPAFRRVTALTLHPQQSLSWHISGMLNAILRFPIVAMYQRSLARAYLDARGDSRRDWLRPSIYPSFGPSTSMYGCWSVGLYTGQIMICFGLEFVSELLVWRLGSEAAWFIGHRYYSWSKL